MKEMPISATAMVWYLPEDFEQIKAMMEDAHVLPATYAEWQRLAEGGEQAIRAKGGRVYRAILRPAEFRSFCESRGLNVNANARNKFASDFAAKEYRAGR